MYSYRRFDLIFASDLSPADVAATRQHEGHEAINDATNEVPHCMKQNKSFG
jgi:hypothetical protein